MLLLLLAAADACCLLNPGQAHHDGTPTEHRESSMPCRIPETTPYIQSLTIHTLYYAHLHTTNPTPTIDQKAIAIQQFTIHNTQKECAEAPTIAESVCLCVVCRHSNTNTFICDQQFISTVICVEHITCIKVHYKIKSMCKL